MKLNLIRKEYKDSDSLEIKIVILRYYKNTKRNEINLILKRNDFYSTAYMNDNFFYFFHKVYLDTHLDRDYIGNLSTSDIKISIKFLHNSVILKGEEGKNEANHQYALYLE